jgi:hypothetical protein
MESVNIYLQSSTNAKKGKKQLMKKKKNLDLVGVCNDSTIMAHSKMEGEDEAAL